jgi:UDP-N-acetyl-D-glucosamine dehydrogenase
MLEDTGLTADSDFFLAFSPERVDPGNQQFTTRNIPKIVGGVGPNSTRLASALYSATVQHVVTVSSTRVAEMVKLLENTFRAVNIGLVNELALMCDRMEIDVWEVVDAAKTKPFGFMAFYPGPGLGGHCIPIDPYYLSWKAKQSGFDPRFIELAGHINGGMPHYVVDKVAEALNTKRKAINGSKILIAGVAYKRDIDDLRESPALDVMGLLHARGASITYADPYVPEIDAREWSGRIALKAVNVSRGSFGAYDCIVVVTDHKAFDYTGMVAEADLIVDTRNAIKTSAPNVFKLGAPRPEGENALA